MTTQEFYTTVDGWRVRYTHAGETGPAVLLLHGLGSSLESWMRNVEPLGRDMRVFAPDILWFGKSDKPDRPPAPDEFTRFVHGFLDAVGVERVTLVGHSMGGLIASKTVLDGPERFDRLVLANAAGYGRELAWWLRVRAMVPVQPRPRRRPPGWITDMAVSQVLNDPRRMPPELLEAVLEVGTTPGLMRAYQHVIRYGVNWRGVKPEVLAQVRDQAHRIELPTLVIWGKQDRVVPVAHAEVIRERMPNARLVVLDDCGHAPMIEHPDEFNALVREFVCGSEAPRG